MAEDALVPVVLEKPVAGGRSLARVDGRVVLVSGGVPGERVRIALERTGKGVAFGRVVDIDEASADRVVPAVDPRCGGLAFAHVSYPRQLDLKREIVVDALTRIGRLTDLPPIQVIGSPVHGWRLRARLHVEGTRVGFHLEGSHVLCDAAPSGQLMAGLLELAQETVARLRPDLTRRVETVLVTASVDGTQQAVHLELAQPLPRGGQPWGGDVGMPGAGPSDCTGVSAGLTGARRATAVSGHPWIRESLNALGVATAESAGLVRHAAAFFQGNRALLPALVSHVLDVIRADDAPVVDLYAGVGLFGITAAAAGASTVTCVEGDPIGAEDLVSNAAPFGGRVRAVRGDVESFVREAGALAHACVVVDPPRTGLSRVVSGALAASPPRRLAYVSCDPATLARDLQTLTGAGLHVERVIVFDLFPVTAHVETLVVLARD